MENKINETIEASVNTLKSMASADTIIGDAIKTEQGTTIIPVSKISIGIVSGGYDGNSKESKNKFGGAGGTGMTMTPVCFLVVKSDGEVELLDLNNTGKPIPDPVGDICNLVERTPDIAKKIKNLFDKKDSSAE